MANYDPYGPPGQPSGPPPQFEPYRPAQYPRPQEPANPYLPRPYAVPPPTNTLAIISLVSAFVVPPAGFICGHLALRQIKRTGEAGNGLAIAGLIVGYLYTAFIVLYVAVIIIAILASNT